MVLTSVLLTLHLLSAIVWIGGMFFAYVCLRPVAAQQFEPPQRLKLWAAVFGKFFPYVWAAIILLLGTGYGMTFSIFGSLAAAPLYVHVMQIFGFIMMLIFMHVYFAPFKRLNIAVLNEDWPEGGKNLNMIRKLISINLTIGLLVVIVAGAGRFLI